MDVWNFFAAVSSDWVSLMSGGFSILFTIIGFSLTNRKTIRKVFWLIGAVCFVLASDRAWTLEHRRFAAEHNALQELRADKKPKPVGKIEQIAFADVRTPKEFAGRTAVVVVVSLRNQGADSVFENWELTVFPKGSSDAVRSVHVTIPSEKMNYTDGGRGPIKSMPMFDALDRKTFPDALKRGFAVRGFLIFLADKNLDSGEAVGSKFMLRYKDAFDGIHEISDTSLKIIKDLGYLPGMQLKR